MIALIVIAALLVATMLPLKDGIKIKIVKSGSMEPAIKTGGIVIDKPEGAYQVGDVITFGMDTKSQVPTTHRIVSVSSGPNPIYTTKGDANDAVDQTNTHLSDIHGKVIFTVPYIGYILDFGRKPLGFALLVGVPAALIILEELGKIVRELQQMRRVRRRKEELVIAHEQQIYQPRRPIVD